MKLKNNESKKQKTCMAIFSDTYKDFAQNTSIHGLKYTVKNDIGRYEKLFWILVVLCGIGGAGYMTVLFWKRYTSNPTRTTVLTTFAPTTMIPFPAITICNTNRILLSKVDQFVKTLNLQPTDEAFVKETIPQLLAFTSANSIQYDESQLLILDRIIKSNGLSVENVMKKVSQSCDEMFLKCTWNMVERNCSTLFIDSYSHDGVCCSFNYDLSTVEHTSLNGLYSGLLVHMDAMVQPVQYSSLHSAGFKVMIHSSQDYPGTGAMTKIVSVGRISYLQLQGTFMQCSRDVRNLPIEQRQCVYAEEKSTKYFNHKYADTNCLTECEISNFMEACGCVPFYYNFAGKPICDIKSIPCLDISKNKKLNLDISKDCDCPSQCEDEFYDVRFTSTKLEKSGAYIHSIVGQNFSEDQVLLNIYFLSDRQTILLRDTITSTIYLLSSFGGVYSLFMGCSMMTIAEILYYAVIRFTINMKLFGRVEENPDLKTAKGQINYVDSYNYFKPYNPPNVFLN